MKKNEKAAKEYAWLVHPAGTNLDRIKCESDFFAGYCAAQRDARTKKPAKKGRKVKP